jgi:hypothetical protein
VISEYAFFQTVTIDKALWLSMAKAKRMRFSGGKLWNVAKRNCENMKPAFEP